MKFIKRSLASSIVGSEQERRQTDALDTRDRVVGSCADLAKLLEKENWLEEAGALYKRTEDPALWDVPGDRKGGRGENDV